MNRSTKYLDERMNCVMLSRFFRINCWNWVVYFLPFLLSAAASAQQGATFQAMNQPIEPYKVIGNIYYVGASDVTSFLITTPEGHILLDSGFAETVPQIEANVAKLGFKLADIKILLISHAHIDHAGGMAELKKKTGATLAVLDAEVGLLERGGKGDFAWGDKYAFSPVKADRILHDKEEVSLGGAVLTVLWTPGHTMGNATWIMKVKEQEREYNVVFMGSVSFPGYRLFQNEQYPAIADDFTRSFATLKTLPCDVFLSQHGVFFSMKEKIESLKKGSDKNPFIDPEGYRNAIQRSENAYRDELQKEQKK
jgi:metallo-beta-lactamase class B